MSTEGGAIVTENCLGKTMITKDPLHNRPRQVESNRGEGLTGEQVPAERISHCQRMAPTAVAQSKLTFEIDGLQLARCGGVEALSEWRSVVGAAGARAAQPVATKNLVDGRACWPCCIGVVVHHASADLLRAESELSALGDDS